MNPLSADRLAAWLTDEARGLRAFVLPLVDDRGRPFGNNGDRLMHAGMVRVLEGSRLRYADQVAEADVLIVPPSGAIRDGYHRMWRCLARVGPAFRGQHVIVLPSSIQLSGTHLSAWLPKAPRTTVFCRERVSLEHVRQRHVDAFGRELSVGLAHDLGFAWVPHEPVKRPLARDAYALVAWRRDRESRIVSSGTMADLVRPLKRKLRNVLPRQLKRRIAAARMRAAGSDRLRRLPAYERWRGPTMLADVSDKTYYTFEEYLAAISGAALVVTDRLHVAVPAAQLGIETHLFEGTYHKIRGVYDLSMASHRNVTLHADR